MFFKYNSQLGPPYQVLIDTNFVNFAIKNKVHMRSRAAPILLPGADMARCGVQLDLVQGMVDCLYAQCTPMITDCVMAELEKLGVKYRVALKVAKVCLLLCAVTLQAASQALTRCCKM